MRALAFVLVTLVMTGAAAAETVTLYAAGRLKAALSDVAKGHETKSGHKVAGKFGPSGFDPNHALRAADRAYLLRDGTQLAEGPVASVLNRTQLEELYRAPVERLVDPETGTVAFLPG